MPVPLKCILGGVKMNNFIKSWSLRLLSILCDKIHGRYFCCLSNYETCFVKRIYVITGGTSDISYFFLGVQLNLKTELTNYGYADFGIWKIFSQKWTMSAYHFKENNWEFLVAMIPFERSNKNWNLKLAFLPWIWYLPNT